MNHLLIIGERRSGTTFLANLLNTQKGITIIPNIFVEFFRPFHEKNWSKKDHELDFKKKLSLSEKNSFLREIKKTLSVYDKRNTIKIDIEPSGFSNLLDLYNYCLSRIPKDEKDLFIGHKVDRPIIKNIINLLNEKSIKIIYIYRDPRDVILSAKIKWPHNSSIKTINKWNLSINEIFSLSNTNLLKIKHEDLIIKNDSTLNKLNEFLNFKLDTSIKELKNYDENWDAKQHSSHNDIKSPFDVNAIYRWKKNPNKYIYQMCSKNAKENLKRLNYEDSKSVSIFSGLMFIIYDINFVLASKIKKFYFKRIKIKSRLYNFFIKLKNN